MELEKLIRPNPNHNPADKHAQTPKQIYSYGHWVQMFVDDPDRLLPLLEQVFAHCAEGTVRGNSHDLNFTLHTTEQGAEAITHLLGAAVADNAIKPDTKFYVDAWSIRRRCFNLLVAVGTDDGKTRHRKMGPDITLNFVIPDESLPVPASPVTNSAAVQGSLFTYA